ncbi:MAG: hypothetical protein GXY81_00945 [Candidatus Cloacimonetes bacterium]|nr:hypothetical protein [Candidatus Cloacimonadota bacterium]
MPLPTTGIRTNPTKEDSILDCQYRNCLSYGQAHNCSIEWKDDGGTIVLSSTFLPSVRPQIMVSNTDNDKVNAALSIHRNSSFSKLGDDKILSGLDTICIAYKQWIEEQEEKRDGIGSDFLMIAGELIEDQKKAFARMSKGVELLRKNKDMLECYKLANASMLVNMLVYSVEHLKRQDPSYYLASEFEDYRYYLFQLAFLLLNIESMVDPGSSDRKDGVDILWFPTGGGKTEAYLLLAAFTFIWRRKKHGSEGCGTAIIMRYTLRLLTSQQFERACKIILAMNYVCKSLDPDILSEGPFSIGLWIGGQSSPNSLKGDRSADECVTDMLNQKDVEQAKAKNRFPLDTCPWCGDSLVKKGDKVRITTGYRIFKNRFKIFCLNPSCMFNESLPIDCVDESLYAFPPSLLFATIDKFAQLAWKRETEAFFGMREGNNPPELIIQDELHLIAGPLGTISGLFENIVELLCSRDEFLPKIIASTATIKNASAQVGNLYGNRKAFSFPPPGLDYNDNFFAVADKREPTREYVGVYPTGKTFITTQVKLLSLLLYSRWELLEHGLKDIDNYWSLVSYHNSLRELGRIVNKAGDEIAHSYKALVYNDYPSKPWRAKFNYPKELTSRITGYSVKKVLASVSMKNVDLNDFDESIRHSIDLVFATNMISVGLDIDRFNLMLVNGQPRSISEYVQVTSRIARKYPGIIISAFNPVRVRDRSHFESFTQFHGSYYKFIEPISITPFTKAAIDRMSATILAAFLRIKMGVEHVKDIDDKTIKALYEYFDNRIKDPEMAQYMREAIQGHLDYAKKKQEWVPMATIGKDLLVKQSQIDADNFTKGIWLAMDSMRDVGSNAVLKIQKQ